MDGIRSRIETQPIRVIITTDDHEIEGFIHIKPGGYQSRVSDLLNMHDLQYIAVTDATIYNLAQQHMEPRKVDTLILRLDIIKMVVPLDEKETNRAPGSEPGGQPGGQPGAGTSGQPGTGPGRLMGGPWDTSGMEPAGETGK